METASGIGVRICRQTDEQGETRLHCKSERRQRKEQVIDATNPSALIDSGDVVCGMDRIAEHIPIDGFDLFAIHAR